MTNHFGRNLIKGRRPLRDKRFRNNINFKVLEPKNVLNSWFLMYSEAIEYKG